MVNIRVCRMNVLISVLPNFWWFSFFEFYLENFVTLIPRVAEVGGWDGKE